MKHWLILVLLVAIALWGVRVGVTAQKKDEVRTASGPFGYTLLTTPTGGTTDIDFFFRSQDCAVCHERQLSELQGSMHSASHEEPLYRSFAELARKEAGEKVYTYCSGCHSPAGVVTGLIPKKSDPELPAEAKAGVTCDVCHQISGLRGVKNAWGEEGNASFVLEPGRARFGNMPEALENRSHTSERKEFFAKSEFCAACHTVIHPLNGIRIENTYGEWKSSVYAAKGIQCQDCHMHSIEDAVKVAETLKTVVHTGQSAEEGPMREIHPHFFAGANANADILAGGKMHAEMAEARLKSAARIELILPREAVPGSELSLDVVVHNIAAGHNIPTGITELRQMWVDLRILDANGTIIFRSGELDEHGEIRPETIWFGAIAGDKSGKQTHKPWEMTQFLANRTVPPKGSIRSTIKAKVPAGACGPINIEAKLLYRSASPGVLAEVMKDQAFAPKIVEMSKTQARLTVP